MRTLAIHSVKGGVGKSTVSANTALLLAKKGYNVCLIDYDLANPNQQIYLNHSANLFLNDYFNDNCVLDECIVDLTSNYSKIKGKMYVIFANPSSQSLSDMVKLDQASATEMLKKTIILQKQLETLYDIDYVILDTSPGIGLIVVNASLVSDAVLFIVKFSVVDIEAMVSMLNGFKKPMSNISLLAVNMVPLQKFVDGSHKLIEKQLQNTLDEKLKKQRIELIGWLPTDQNFINLEFELSVQLISNNDAKLPLLVENTENNLFSKTLSTVINSIVSHLN